MVRPVLAIVVGLVVAVGAFAGGGVRAQTGRPSDLALRLRAGGHVLVMRHARSPRERPAKEEAQPDNRTLERQLDAEGRASAIAMGEALRGLAILIGETLTSPAYRAVETVRLAGLMSYVVAQELGDGGQSMVPVGEAQAEWLRTRAARVPMVVTTNTLLVTHQPNLALAFPAWGASVVEGEVVVLRPDGRGNTALVARVPIEE